MSDLLTRVLNSAEGVYPPLFCHDVLERHSEEELSNCIAAGLLYPGRTSVQVYCYECGEMEFVILLEDADNRTRAYTSCMEVGPVEIPLERLQCWELSYRQLMDAAFGDVGLSGSREEILRDRVWKLGKAKWLGALRNVFFIRGLHRLDAWQVLNQCQFTERSLVFVPDKLPAPDSRIEVLPIIIPLSDVLHWTGETLCFDHAHVESVLAEQRDAKLSRNSEQPVRKRAERVTTIERLTKQMMEHIKAARDHAHTKSNFGREPELLPRPTKRELARLIGTSEVTVGRSFQDPTARELRFLWELAEDLPRLLEYRHAPIGGSAGHAKN